MPEQNNALLSTNRPFYLVQEFFLQMNIFKLNTSNSDPMNDRFEDLQSLMQTMLGEREKKEQSMLH